MSRPTQTQARISDSAIQRTAAATAGTTMANGTQRNAEVDRVNRATAGARADQPDRMNDRAEVDARRAEVDARRAEVDAKRAEVDAKRAEVDAGKRAEVDAKRAQADAKRAQADAAKKADTDAKRAEADAKRAQADAKRAEAQAKKAQEEAKKAEMKKYNIETYCKDQDLGCKYPLDKLELVQDKKKSWACDDIKEGEDTVLCFKTQKYQIESFCKNKDLGCDFPAARLDFANDKKKSWFCDPRALPEGDTDITCVKSEKYFKSVCTIKDKKDKTCTIAAENVAMVDPALFAKRKCTLDAISGAAVCRK